MGRHQLLHRHHHRWFCRSQRQLLQADSCRRRHPAGNSEPDLFSPHLQQHLAANKTVAWIDYMTNYNRTYGDFAAGEALDFMVLNRRYEVSNNNTINDLTTYIDPQKYIEIFADTSIDSQNFWVQTVVQATRRGNYSAKQIPFL